MSLFRAEAVAHATRRLDGEVVLATPLSTRLLGGITIAVVVALAAFACTATYARRETVAGWLIPESGMIRVEALQGGRVEALSVAEGDAIAEGDRIATLRLSPDTASGRVGERLAVDLEREASAARSRASAQLQRLELEETQLRDRRPALLAQRREIQNRIDLARKRARLAADDADRARGLAEKGVLPRRDLETRLQAVLIADDYVSQLSSQNLELARQVDDLDARLMALPVDAEAARADAESAAAGLGQRKTESEARDSYSVVAPIDGVIAALPLMNGQMAATGATVAVITPENSPLIVELFAPSRSAGFIKTGQEVRIHYDAFPFQKFGSGTGRIIAVSRTVLSPAEVDVPGLVLREPAFRVRVALNEQSVAAYGQPIPLRPGMTANADIILARRTLFEWLLDPLFAAGRRG